MDSIANRQLKNMMMLGPTTMRAPKSPESTAAIVNKAYMPDKQVAMIAKTIIILMIFKAGSMMEFIACFFKLSLVAPRWGDMFFVVAFPPAEAGGYRHCALAGRSLRHCAAFHSGFYFQSRRLRRSAKLPLLTSNF